MRKTVAAFAVALAALIAVLIPSSAQARTTAGDVDIRVHSSHKGWCIKGPVSVAPAEGQPRSWDVLVDFCQPFRPTHEVDVLTHGATYTHSYWDWTQQSSTYSYVGRALADGRATLAYDRVGNGASTRPDSSTAITMTSDAYVLNQLIEIIKKFGFWRVNSIGHSYGSGVVLAEAAKYGNVDNVVVTGYLHRPSNPQVTAGNYPANQDDKFKSLQPPLDNGWLTTRPGARAYGFHSPTSDPDLIALDEQQKDLVSLTGLLSFLAQRSVPAGDNISQLINLPVLIVTGQLDAIFCYQPTVFDCSDQGVVAANEAPFYRSSTSVTIPESGHDLTLHPTGSGASYQVISHWLSQH